MPPATTVVSCPGKVLMAGGYLVLEPENDGLVVGTASRFYTVVQDTQDSAKASSSSASPSQHRIIVNSPQFTEATWTYEVRVEAKGDGCTVQQVQDGASKNVFVQEALKAAIKISVALGARPNSDLMVNIAGDNDFYSQERSTSPSASSVALEPAPFTYLNTTLGKVHKTGLGSSAAMVTSLVAGLFLHMVKSQSKDGPDDTQLRLIHNVAQYAHSKAQGKVGSGFDVSSAVFGSQIYHRFATKCLQELLELEEPSPASLLQGLDPMSPLWCKGAPTAGRVEPFSLPPMTTMLLADVDAGSNTPSMVKTILKWKTADPQSETIWSTIAQTNKRLAAVFASLRDVSKVSARDYIATVEDLSAQRSSQWTASQGPIHALFCEARDTMQKIRQQMKAMGIAAAVPIEPDEQTRILDSCTQGCQGVIGAGVPGAGGYDAIWVLVLQPGTEHREDISLAEQQVRKVWSSWEETSIQALSRGARIHAPLSEAIDRVDKTGLITHTLQDIHGLERAIGSVHSDGNPL